MGDRDFDVIVFGATGVTGRQVAAHLAGRAAEEGLAWAAAARDTARAGAVLAEVGVQSPELLRADVGDAGSLAEMAARATVVLDLVGPYALYGRPVIRACVAASSHYVDLTGEIPFAREVLDEFDGPARRAGVTLTQVCGFEALPADVLVRLVVAAARDRTGESPTAVDVEVTITSPPGPPRLSDFMSGGTFQSAVLLTGADDAARATDPAALIDDPDYAERVRDISPIVLSPRRGGQGAVIAPMVPAPFINPAVIHRTEMLAARIEGRGAQPFRYREGMDLSGSPATAPLRWAVAGALSGSQVALRALAGSSPRIRRPMAQAMSRLGPSSGYGPTTARMVDWTWSMTAVGHTDGAVPVRATVTGEGHPGYLATARMLGEAGIMLAQAGVTPDVSGCVTPAIALGAGAAAGLAPAGVHFTVDA